MALKALHDQVHRQRAFGHDVDPKDLHCGQRQRMTEKKCSHQHQDLVERRGEQEYQDLPKVPTHQASLLHSPHQGCEVVVAQHDVRRLLRHFRPRHSHRNPHIRLRQRGRIVHSIARHRHHMTLGLECPDDLKLLFRANPRKHSGLPDRIREDGVPH
jgi:hypothetical protein